MRHIVLINTFEKKQVTNGPTDGPTNGLALEKVGGQTHRQEWDEHEEKEGEEGEEKAEENAEQNEESDLLLIRSMRST